MLISIIFSVRCVNPYKSANKCVDAKQCSVLNVDAVLMRSSRLSAKVEKVLSVKTASAHLPNLHLHHHHDDHDDHAHDRDDNHDD